MGWVGVWKLKDLILPVRHIWFLYALWLWHNRGSTKKWKTNTYPIRPKKATFIGVAKWSSMQISWSPFTRGGGGKILKNRHISYCPKKSTFFGIAKWSTMQISWCPLTSGGAQKKMEKQTNRNSPEKTIFYRIAKWRYKFRGSRLPGGEEGDNKSKCEHISHSAAGSDTTETNI